MKRTIIYGALLFNGSATTEAFAFNMFVKDQYYADPYLLRVSLKSSIRYSVRALPFSIFSLA
ncbi:hypothetical protein QE441_001024 [Chryseobacterium sp. SORGH_AS909]|uniref:Uncharacterized protein n=1 Tax=Chryseobacterium camelliae TaxID=1265445 RepID=A0ABU0TLD5_9FLAO|nr:hypothetical protein [Chryseobacterium camelliae]MDQ1101792.1 hypothetical protein [Chryseobacterium sp. SORGH_AS_1048]MDR6085230.1 hypothetical protein [Chryseobacterium sp. SORGH_AS_0909]MDR6129588.1 hypothetical protein [Chryseobacterium sp. SORGH_AS_1175]MDT3408287.1 hypothetical protein [Pseudacidovorax intermedius]